MTTLTLVTPASVPTGVGSVVTIGVTVDDSSKPRFATATGLLAPSKGDTGTWTATWATEKVGTYSVTVTAGDATPVIVEIVATDGGTPTPTPGQLDLDVAGLMGSPTSATRAAQLAALTGDLTATFAPRRVHVILAAGQSNMSGRGAEYSTAKDPGNGRIKQWNSTTGTFVAATEPLLMHDAPTGIGPALQFARNMLERIGPLDLVYIVGTAHGGTALSTDETPLGWRWGVSGNLSAQAVTKTQAALTAAVAANPGVPVSLAAMLWFQGETDSTTTAMVPLATYRADLDALIAGFRSTFAAFLRDAILPVIVYRMIPEALGSGTRDQIDAVHQNTPYRLASVGVVPSIAGQSNGDNLHANAAQHRTNGPVAFAEFQRILSGRAPVYPDAAFTSQVTGLLASIPSNGTSVGLSWTTSVNATSYLIEYKASAASTWLTGPASAATSGTVAGLTSGTSYDFRVTASNALGSAAPSATTTATPAATPPGSSIFTDNFNRADAAVLGSTSTGSLPWQVVGTGGSGLVASNRGGVANTGAARTIAFVNAGYADCVYKATLAVKDSGIESLVFRYADVNNNLFLSRESGSSIKWALWKRVGGTATLVQASTVNITAADQIEISLNGSSVVVKINGATAITTTVTELATASGYGFGSITTYAARWDDVSAVTI